MPDFVRSHGPKVAIGGLVLINAALVTALIVRQPALIAEPAGLASPTAVTATSPARPTSSAGPTAASASPTATPTSAATATESSSGSPSASGTTSAQVGLEAGRRLLAASSAQIAWRATTADSCRERSTLEVSTDAGRSWRSVNTGLRSIVRLKTYDDESVFVVGADADCRAAFVRVSDPQGSAVRDDDQLSSTWYRMPSRPDRVHSPSGRTSTPCGSRLIALAGLGTYGAAALCDDGRVRTVDEGRGWTTVATATEGLALNADDTEFVLLASDRDCAGLTVRRFGTDGRGLRSRRDCFDGLARSEAAVAIRGSSTWVWASDAVRVS